MDEKDLKIIEILEKNARTPYTEIASILGISEGTVRNRIEKLGREGVIKRYTIEVDPKKMGYQTIVLLGMDVEPKHFLSAAEELSKLDCVKWIYTSTGDHMIMAEVWAKDTADLNRMISEKISKIEGVMDLCPAILMEKIK
jgi:Lrp/AsnC family transcriptional regulator for asnA, asnC and gidA